MSDQPALHVFGEVPACSGRDQLARWDVHRREGEKAMKKEIVGAACALAAAVAAIASFPAHAAAVWEM